MTTHNKGIQLLVWKGISIALFALLVVVTFYFLLHNDKNDTIAVVDGDKITKAQLYQSLVDYEGSKILEKLITENLVMKESNKAGVVVQENEFQAAYDKVRNGFQTNDEYLSNLKDDGYTDESLRTELRTQLYIRKLLEPKVQVDENDVRLHYEEHMATDPAAQSKSQEQVIAQVREELTNEKVLDLMEPWFEELRSRAKISVFLPGIQLTPPKEVAKVK